MADNFHDVYLRTLRDHVTDYDYYNCPRDQYQYEKLFSHFTLTDPVERVCYAKERRANIIFQFAEALWYLSGTDALDFISYYAPRMVRYSADGKTLTGTAYGRKIFSYQSSKGFLNQWENAKRELLSHRESKRCVITIFSPDELTVENNIDVSCTLSMQFICRDGKLHMISTMRANDVYRGALSDVFSFTFLHELMAREIGCELGHYHHQVGSSHLYSCDYEKAKCLIGEPREFRAYSLRFPTMPPMQDGSALKMVLSCEQALRNNVPYSQLEAKLVSLDPYWRDVILLFEIYRELKHGECIKRKYVASLDGTLRYMVENYLEAKGASYELE